MWLGRPDRDDATLVANADGDELTFVHEGAGRVESPLGVLDFEPGDYVFVPRSLLHRWRLDRPAYLLTIEARSWVDLPRQFRNPVGQLTMDAPYSHRDFREPRWPEGGPATLGAPREALVYRQGRLSRFEHAHDPFDVVGWDGQVWPYAFPIRAFQPKTGLVHLPPTIHITFAGQGFVVCSFVPRVVDFHPEAIPCPYPHSSVDCDEIIFYAAGNFTSRRGIEPGSVTLHPVGVPHGPHPGRYEASIGTTRTSELAVMVDTFSPLGVTAHARAVEDGGYNRSWAFGRRQRRDRMSAGGRTLDPRRSSLAGRSTAAWWRWVVPRPIALVSTVDAEGRPNLAPFSFFTVVSANPPYLAFSPQRAGRTGEKKDTLRNVEATGQFVVAVVTEAIAERVNACAARLPRGESEFAHSGLTPAPAPARAPAAGGRVAGQPGVRAGRDPHLRRGGRVRKPRRRAHLLPPPRPPRCSTRRGRCSPRRWPRWGAWAATTGCATRERFPMPRPE
ncbi:MAG: flavin reductase [Thermoanaerobaculaceae bacterium]